MLVIHSFLLLYRNNTCFVPIFDILFKFLTKTEGKLMVRIVFFGLFGLSNQ